MFWLKTGQNDDFNFSSYHFVSKENYFTFFYVCSIVFLVLFSDCVAVFIGYSFFFLHLLAMNVFFHFSSTTGFGLVRLISIRCILCYCLCEIYACDKLGAKIVAFFALANVFTTVTDCRLQIITVSRFAETLWSHWIECGRFTYRTIISK